MLKDLFTFTSSERNGILILVALILLVMFSPVIFRKMSREKEFDAGEYNDSIALFIKSIRMDSLSPDRKPSRQLSNYSKPLEKGAEQTSLFPFNPNHLNADQWRLLGLTDWQVRIIHNYESKGGTFRYKEDLSKIYGVSEELYKRLEPFIQLPVRSSSPDYPPTKRLEAAVDLNTADSIQLIDLKGVGPVLARRIMKYRESLGGFHSSSQLLEVYGMDVERFQKFAATVSVIGGPYRKLNINKASLSELKKHPYIDYTLAKWIIDRRILKGRYTSLEQIKESDLVTDEIFVKLSPYFCFE